MQSMDWEKIFELCLSNERLLPRMQKGHLQVNAKHTDVPIQKKKKKSANDLSRYFEKDI